MRIAQLLTAISLAACATPAATYAPMPISAKEASLRITTAADQPAEREAVAQFNRLLERYDLDRWIFTLEVRIDMRAIPHSHPVLTLHARYVNGQDDRALTTFVHEQGHWYFHERSEATAAAIAELGALYPQTPSSAEGGAGDRQSTLLHLMVCTLEYDAMTSLVGAERTRTLFAEHDVYRWVRARVLDEAALARIRAVMARHDLDGY